MADIGFTQFIVPNNLVLSATTNITSSDCDINHPIEKIKDGNIYTYCSLKKNVANPYIIIDFGNIYKINYIRCLFNVFFTKIKIYDFSNNTQGELLGELNRNERGINSFDIILNNKQISKIKIVDFETYFEEDNIDIIEVQADFNEVVPPEGYHFKQIKIISQPVEKI